MEIDTDKLLAELLALKAQRYLCDCWISMVAPGGRGKAYPRLQSHKKMFRGKTTKHIGKGKKVADYEVMIERGRRIKVIEKILKKHQQKHDQ